MKSINEKKKQIKSNTHKSENKIQIKNLRLLEAKTHMY